MANPIKFLEGIQNFNGEAIDENVLTKTNKLMLNPSYTVETMKS
jgi:hypothetical protein